MRAGILLALCLVVLVTGCAVRGERAARRELARAAEIWDASSSQAERERQTTVAIDAPSPASLDSDSLSTVALIQYGLHQNEHLRAQFERWRAALTRVPYARSLPDPTVHYAYLIEPIETRVGPQRQRIGFTQAVPFPFKLGARGRVQLARANAEAARYRAAQLDLISRIRAAAAEWGYLERAIDIASRNATLLESFEEVARARYAAGTISHESVMRAQIELGRIDDEVRSLRARREPWLARIRALTGWPAETELPPLRIAGTEERSTSALPEANGAEAGATDALRVNPELAAATATIVRLEAERSLAGWASWPDLSVGAEWVDTGEARIAGVEESGQDPVIAKLAVTLPVWLGANRAQRQATAANLAAAEAERRDLELRLLAELSDARYRREDARARLALYTDALIPRAAQALEVARRAFSTGETSFLDLIAAQRTLLELELDEARAGADLAQARAAVARLTGTPLPAETAGRKEVD